MGLLASVGTPTPNRDIFETHFNNGKDAIEQGKYAEAKVHFEYTAKSIEDSIKMTKDPEIRKLREEMLVATRAILEDCKEKAANPPVPEQLVLPARGVIAPSSVQVAQVAPDQDTTLNVEQFIYKDKKLFFDDIVGHEHAKKLLTNLMIKPFLHPELAEKWDAPAGGLVLLYGPYGTGKTSLAAAVAGEVDADFYTIDSAALTSRWFGDSEKLVNSLFDGIRARSQRAVIFIDEVAGIVTDGGAETHNAQERILNAFLTQLEGIQSSQRASNCKFLFIGNTNKPWDVALGMLSRFRGNLIYMGLPNEQEREEILRSKLGKVKLGADVDLSDVARRTDLYSGRDLDAVCCRAKSEAMDRNANDPDFDAIPQEMLLAALSETPGGAAPEQLERLKEWSKSRGIKVPDRVV